MNTTSVDGISQTPDSCIAVLDTKGNIVAINEEWKRVDWTQSIVRQALDVGANYAEACEAIVQSKGDSVAQALLVGIHDLLQGVQQKFSLDYPIKSESGERWYNVRLTRFSLENTYYILIVREDISEHKLAENKHRETEAMLAKVLETLPIGVWIMNKDGRIVHGNPAGQNIWAGARFVGPEQFGEYKGWWLKTGHLIEPHEWAAARAIEKGETSIDEEILIECFDGSKKIILNSAIPLRDTTGDINGAIIVNQDITLRKRAEQQLVEANAAVETMNQELKRVLEREKQKARTDDLTELSNRRHFFEIAEQAFSVAQRYQSELSVVLFDIDHFKRVNDTYGHQVGDRVLKHVARLAKMHKRYSDVFARYGGEEFIFLLPNTNAEGAFVLAEHMRNKIAQSKIQVDNVQACVTISAGVAEMLLNNDTLDHLVHRADGALYEAKNAGRNCCKLSGTLREMSPSLN